MMALVRLALRRPISVVVMALLMLVLGVLSFELMNVDIFPEINLPVVLEVWNYPGLSAIQIERRMVWISERGASTTVNGIEHIDSTSMNGLGILKIYFYPGADIGGAIAQISSVSESILSQLPRGTVPPQIISYDAANVPVAQLNIFSDVLSEQEIRAGDARKLRDKVTQLCRDHKGATYVLLVGAVEPSGQAEPETKVTQQVGHARMSFAPLDGCPRKGLHRA